MLMCIFFKKSFISYFYHMFTCILYYMYFCSLPIEIIFCGYYYRVFENWYWAYEVSTFPMCTTFVCKIDIAGEYLIVNCACIHLPCMEKQCYVSKIFDNQGDMWQTARKHQFKCLFTIIILALKGSLSIDRYR